MNNSQQWINESGTFFPVSGDTRLLESPGSGVFVVVQISTPMMKRIGLKKIGVKFDFDFKLYELGSEPIIRLVKKTWNSETFIEGNKNLGVIFNGIKGTGKTISAKLLCNAIGLPVVIVQNNGDGLLPFLQSLNFECVVFIDEAEKTFKKGEDDDILLRLIDGVYNACRRLYILTTNQLTLNDNLLGRPGRIRYRFEFSNLLPEAIEEYLKDNLKPELVDQKEKILQQIDLLEISTIDILKALVDEVNIHGQLPEKPCLNIPVAKFAYEILQFHYLECIESKTEVMTFIRSKMAESGYSSLNEWINKWKSNDGKKDAVDLLSDKFEYVSIHTMTSTSSSLWRETTTSMGTITSEPDADGFFLMRSRYDDSDSLCYLLKKKESPSLYRGMLA
ncbi:MAG: AAA family ATPase [Bacteroidaceae bacterium]|nr:AAA family ATPase [Bacteroidaceae bacterium]